MNVLLHSMRIESVCQVLSKVFGPISFKFLKIKHCATNGSFVYNPGVYHSKTLYVVRYLYQFFG